MEEGGWRTFAIALHGPIAVALGFDHGAVTPARDDFIT